MVVADEWAVELLVARRDIGTYSRAVERIAEEAAADHECEMEPAGYLPEDVERIYVEATAAGPVCSRVEASEYVTLLLNGAGTVVGAVVEGAPAASWEG